MKVSRENYEIFFTDYLDGKLDTLNTAELMLFLSKNSDLEQEFNEFTNFYSKDPEINYTGKDLLKRTLEDIEEVNENNFDEFCAASLENDLTDNSVKKLTDFMKANPLKYKDFIDYHKTLLIPDYSVKYKNKQKLKKSSGVFYLFRRNILYISSAAAIIIFLISTLIKTTTDKTNNSKYSSVKHRIEEKNIPAITAQKPVSRSVKQKYMIPVKSQETTKYDEFVQNSAVRMDTEQIEKITAGKEYFLSSIPVSKINFRQQNIPYTAVSDSENEGLLTFSEIRNKVKDYSNELIASKFNLWTLADAGVKSINLLTESGLKLSKETNDNGEVIAYSIKSNSLTYSTRVKE